MYFGCNSADQPLLPKAFKSSNIYFNIFETKLQDGNAKILIFFLWSKRLGLFFHNSLHTALNSLQFLIHSIALPTSSFLGPQLMCAQKQD